MSHIDDYIRHVEEVTLPALRRDLEPLESGAMHIRKRDAGGPWIETTAAHAEGLRKAIREYESIVNSLRKGEVP